MKWSFVTVVAATSPGETVTNAALKVNVHVNFDASALCVPLPPSAFPHTGIATFGRAWRSGITLTRVIGPAKAELAANAHMTEAKAKADRRERIDTTHL